jgi:hypothetical protein
VQFLGSALMRKVYPVQELLTAENAERAEKPKVWLCVLRALGGEKLLDA